MRKFYYFFGVMFISITLSGCGATLQQHIIGNDLKGLKVKVNNGANVNVKYTYGKTPLIEAAYRGKIEMVKFLVKKGANINDKNNFGQSALHEASYTGNLVIVKYLVEKGADYSDGTALKTAKKRKKVKVIQYFNKLTQEKENKKTKIKELKKERERASNRDRQRQLTEKVNVNQLIRKKDFIGLKKYIDKNPDAVCYIKDDKLLLAFTGPKGLKVGDIRKHIKDGTDEILIISLIKRVKEPYKEFTFDEIKFLQSIGLSSKIISTMMDVTTELLKDDKIRKQQEFFLKQQQRIKDEKVDRNIYKNNSEQKIDEIGNPILDEIQDRIIEKGVEKLLDKLF